MGLWHRLTGRAQRREDPPAWRDREDAPWSPLYGLDDEDERDDGWREPPRPFVPVAEPASVVTPGGRTRGWWVRHGLAASLAVLILLIGWLAVTAPLSKSLQPIVPPQITLLAADGTPIARNGANVDAPVAIAELPPHVVEAFLAIEDRRFYQHWGIDPLGIARAVWGNLTSGRTQGGSTITQQLAKFTFLTPEQSLTRKGREALIAFWLEAWLSKDEILERYLSNAYFGDNTYGLRAASMHYFHRHPERLTVAQAAMLAGLLQAPSRYAPTKNYALARERMETVVGAMVDAEYLTAAQGDALRAPRLDVRGARTLPTGTYFADWALPQARRVASAGYARQTLVTTLDSRLQNAARRAVERASLGKAQVALVAMRTTGEVVAMIGGRDYGDSPFNRATQARRQPGSTFKLFVYLAALEDGWEPEDPISNQPITEGSYRPGNSGGRYSEFISLEDAFAQSSNVAAVRLLGEVGSDRVIEMAQDLGITGPMPEGDPSLALGTTTVTLLQLTAAYGGVAANRFPVQPRALPVEERGWLGRLWDWLFNRPDSLSTYEHGAMEQMLRAAVNRGTGRAAVLQAPNFGKTGTTQDNRDALFVGYSGDLVVGVWVGNDDNSPLPGGMSGGGVPARIWRDFMQQALGERSGPVRRRDAPAPNPSGPVQPLDLPDIGDVPLGGEGGPVLRLDDGGAVISSDVAGMPLDLRLDENGVSVSSGPPPEPAPGL
ncbi:transglycosylase domain-containing protein [Croceibacterium mercuriale]|uniref:transglycosylase domain-containing protein n=1 Tax=Croceibacterium mercuriale TaxID=1572751 RepID=UPI00068C85B3|nr:transglycosylase domain-containing protein [Croceibacterium mercuriale]